MTDATLPPRGHNNPPIVAPSDVEFHADLQARYPELATELSAFEKALETYPTKLTLKDEETAAALQDLLGKMKKQQSVWKAHRGSEKKPWDTLVKVAQNFFGKAEERVDGWLETWKPIHQAFLDLKAAENRRKAEEEAERQRQESERLRQEAEAAEARRVAALEAEAAARRREEEARQRAVEEQRKRLEAEAAAERARAEEKRIADEKRERERAEKDLNAENLRAITKAMKTVEKLHALAEAEEASEEEIQELDALIRPGGTISALAGPVASSHLLTDEQKADVEFIRTHLADLRTAFNARVDAKERKRREKLRKEAEAQEAAAAAARADIRQAEEARADAARIERERLQAEADAAKERERAAKGDVRDARTDARGAVAEQKGAAKDASRLETDADRAGNRADRMERRVENSTDADFGRTRGDLGSVGSNSGRWVLEILDENALRATCGPLGEHFTADALNGAAYRWMQTHRQWFVGERVEGQLAGVVFIWERGAVIRA